MTEKDESLLSTDLVQGVLAASAVSAICTECKAVEFVIPLDDQPIDPIYLANYLCDECEAGSA